MVYSSGISSKTLILVLSIISATDAVGFSNRLRPAGQPWVRTIVAKRAVQPVVSAAAALQASTAFIACQISREDSLAVDSILGTHNAQDCLDLLPFDHSLAATSALIIPSTSSTMKEPPTATLAAYQDDSNKIQNATTTTAAAASAATLPTKAVTTPIINIIAGAPAISATHGCTSSSSAVCAAQAEALTEHNIVRARHHVAPLVWSDTLSIAAMKWAKTCTWSHSPTGSILPPTTHYGESIYASTGQDAMTTAVSSFSIEEGEYDFANPGFTQLTGQFTQVVWKDTTEVGCALIQCNLGVFAAQTNSSTLAVCVYYPAGNVNSIAAFEQNVLPA